jgi:catechol 2,3-dioxygenase-like lactoylglutathione lyase family enzyme
MARTAITGVATVFVPVEDADASISFYVERLGFEVRADFPYGDGDRWVEVAPPGGGIALALVSSEGHPGGWRERTVCALTCSDIEALHAELTRAGVDLDPIAEKGSGRAGLFLTEATISDPSPPQFLFRDPDGNRFLVVQT